MKDGQVRCLRDDGEKPGKMVRCVIFCAIEADGVHSSAASKSFYAIPFIRSGALQYPVQLHDMLIRAKH